MKEIITHEELVRRLVKPGEVIRSQLGADDCHLQHMVIGLSGEVFELWEWTCGDRGLENLKEEIGDCLFYAEAIRQIYSLDFDFCVEHAKIARTNDVSASSLTLLSVECGRLLDSVKRTTIYRKQIDVLHGIAGPLGGVVFHLDLIAKSRGLTLDVCKSANIEKLSKRYNDLKYTDQAALARADKKTEE